jgi:UPF0716 protein FxsA
MLKLLLLYLLIIPFVEVYLFIYIGNLIGVLPVMGLCVLTALTGAVLVHNQGIQTARRMHGKIQNGELPAADMMEAVILLVAGLHLLTPGFFTDLAGLACLLPAFRTRMAAAIVSRMQLHTQRSNAQHPVTIEGEFWEEARHLPEHDNRPAGDRG